MKKILIVICKFTLCKLGLHLVATVIETRPRFKGKHVGGFSSYGTSKFSHYVQGDYDQCVWCGKKFSYFKTIRHYGK